ncbi:TWiK family of potassium channels protein 18-like isoform X3 [Cloeon dipterum]|uniref:Potassium channel domain-containing protein n=1 Tax=Cloeon dipterum TaxID=197152 RepID=A0A8S1CCW0_9INSE|nr:Hypothetical predicted protein [Cloeon dipterum]
MTQSGASVPVTRSSVRSRSSGGSSSEVDPREKVKACCRKLVEFMFTQVGVGGLVVCYAIVGAFAFQHIETAKDPKWEVEWHKAQTSPDHNLKGAWVQLAAVKRLTNLTANKLWDVTSSENVFNITTWKKSTDMILHEFQEGIVDSVKKGYDGREPEDAWTLPAALMFCLSIFTMIGYGNMVPKTTWGKVATILYAVFGIPVYILYFMNMGKVFANCFRWIYRTMYECTTKKPSIKVIELENGDTVAHPRVIVPTTACLWVISGYVLGGTIMFAEWEGWDYLDSAYFCVTSLCKIGIGDFVPGANILESRSGNQTKLVINFMYLLLGMGLIAMCYNLMREEVKVKMQDLKRDMRKWLEGLRIQSCYGKKKSKRYH